MLGIGKSNYGYGKLQGELKSWNLKPALIDAFMKEYSGMACKYYKNLSRAYEANVGDIQFYRTRDEVLGMALVEAAYDAWEKYLSKGNGIGTDSELSVWAIMWNRSDLLQDDRTLLARSADEKFPDIFSRAFD